MSIVEDINAAHEKHALATARREARNQALEEAAAIHDERVKDMRWSLGRVRSAAHAGQIERTITIHEDSAAAIRALKEG